MSSDRTSGERSGFRAPKADPRTVRPHMVRLGLAVKLAQGAFDGEHVSRLEPSMMQHLATAAEGASREDVLRAKARPGSKPTMAAAVGVTEPGQHAFDSPARAYELAAQRSLALAIQEKMGGDSSSAAAATSGPAWQSALRNATASPRGVVALPVGRPSADSPDASAPPAAATSPPQKQLWRPAMRPRTNPKSEYVPGGGTSPSAAASAPASPGGAASLDSPAKGGSSSAVSAFAFPSGSGTQSTGALLPAQSPISSGAATVKLRGNINQQSSTASLALSVTSPSATLRPTTAPPGAVNFDLKDARNPMAALTFKRLDTETGKWAPKQYRSAAGAPLAHLPQTLTDIAIAKADQQAARTHDRLLKASVHSPAAAPSPAMLAALNAGGATLTLRGSPAFASTRLPAGMSETAFLAAHGPRPTAAGYSPSRLVPSKGERDAVAAADPRFIPGTTGGPRIPPHPEQGPPEGSSPASPLLSASRRPTTAAGVGMAASQRLAGSTSSTSLFGAPSPLQSTAASFYGSSSLRPTTAPAGGDKAAQLLATYASMHADATAGVSASKAAQARRRAEQRSAAEAEAARARQAMLHVQCAV